jgi:hypothetical protein
MGAEWLGPKRRKGTHEVAGTVELDSGEGRREDVALLGRAFAGAR